MRNPIRGDQAARARLLAGAGLFAILELAAGLLIGRFFEWGRAEGLPFLAFRPWLVLVAAVAVAHRPWRQRYAFYVTALVLAVVSESLLLSALGGSPWEEAARGLAAGLMVLLPIDWLVTAGTRVRGRLGTAVAAVIAVMLLIIPGALRPYDAIILGAEAAEPARGRPTLLLLTGLPLVWGESGPFDPASRPIAAYRYLEREFAVRPIDYLDARTLGSNNLLLLAQPHALAPVELVALDAWVRRGGHLLILADPDLVWPTAVALGDPRRPPPTSMLAPLLDHWGVGLGPPKDRGTRMIYLRDGRERRRLVLAAPGRFSADNRHCRIAAQAWFAACRIGAGRALLIADADFLHDDLWTSPVPRGDQRHARTADNPLLLAAWLDQLTGHQRPRSVQPVRWLVPPIDRRPALIAALLPILATLAAAGAIAANRG